MDDSFYEHFSLIENIEEVLGSTSKKAKEIFIKSVAEKFLDVIVNPVPLCPIKMEVLRLLNLFLEDSSHQLHQEILKNEDVALKLGNLFLGISTVGDFELQSMIMECLIRFYPIKSVKTRALKKINTDPEILSAFIDIRGNEFEVDCRNFLNKVNKQNESFHKRVISLPAEYVKLDGEKLLKPSEEEYDDFWVDFNLGSKRVTVFCQPFLLSSQLTQNEARWETLSVRAQDVHKFECKALGKMWKIAVELKNHAQILTQPGAEGQTHLFVCGINTMYDARSALNNTFGGKMSSVTTPLKISQRSTDGSESSCVFISADVNQGQATSLPFSHRSSSKNPIQGFKKEKVSVPCYPMCPNSLISISNSSSSSKLIVPVVESEKPILGESGNNGILNTDTNILLVEKNQRLINGEKHNAGLTDFKHTSTDEVIQMTQKRSDSMKSLPHLEPSNETSEKVLKHLGKFSRDEDIGLCATKDIHRSKDRNKESSYQKQQKQNRVGSGDAAQSTIYHDPSPMTPGGDGFSLSVAEAKCKGKKITSHPLTHASKNSISLDKEKNKAKINDVYQFQEDLLEAERKPKYQPCGKKDKRNLKLPHKSGEEGEDSYDAYIIPDSLPGQASLLPYITRTSQDTGRASKPNRNKGNATLKDMLGLDKNQVSALRCQENSKSDGKTSPKKVILEEDNNLNKNTIVVSSGTTNFKNNRTKTKKGNNKTPDAQDELRNDQIYPNERESAMSSSVHNIIGNEADKTLKTVTTTDKTSLSISSKPESSLSGQLYIEIDKTTKIQPYYGDKDEVIDETQIEISPFLSTGEEDLKKIRQKTTVTWLQKGCNNRNENQRHNFTQFTGNDGSEMDDRNKPNSPSTKFSLAFNGNLDSNENYVDDSSNHCKRKRSSKTASKINDKEKTSAFRWDTTVEQYSETGMKSYSRMEPTEKFYTSNAETDFNNKSLPFASRKNKKDSSLDHIGKTSNNQDKQHEAEKPRRVLRARKNVNYNETGSFDKNLQDTVQHSLLVSKNEIQRKSLVKQNESQFEGHFKRVPLYSYLDDSKPLSRALPTISKHMESLQEINTPYNQMKGTIKKGITIKRNRMETVSSFLSERQSYNQTDPYDFDFECKVRSKETQHFVPYKSWSFNSPALETKEPETMPQEDNHRKSKKLNVTKNICHQSQIACQKKITFNESKKGTIARSFDDCSVDNPKEEHKSRRKERENASNEKRKMKSHILYRSQEQSCLEQRKSMEYLQSEPDTPDSSNSGLRFPPLEDSIPHHFTDDNEAWTDKDRSCAKSVSARSELSWVKNKKILKEDKDKQRGKTYAKKKASTFSFQMSDEENDEVIEELDYLSHGSNSIEASPCKEVTSPLVQHPYNDGWQSKELDEDIDYCHDDNSSCEMTPQEHDVNRKEDGSFKKITLSSFLHNLDTETKNDTKEKHSPSGNRLFNIWDETKVCESDAEEIEETDLQEDCTGLASPKVSVGGSSQHLSNLSSKFDLLFQEVMSKVSGGETTEMNNLKPPSGILSGPASNQRLTKSALKRKYPQISSSVYFSEDTTGSKKKMKSSPKLVKRKLFMSERKCLDLSLASPKSSPLISMNLSPMTSPLTGYSKSSSGSNISVGASQTITSMGEPADEEDDQMSQNDFDDSNVPGVMYQTLGRAKLQSDSSDVTGQLKDVFKSVSHSMKSPKLRTQNDRLKAFKTFGESLNSVYFKMKETDGELKRSEANLTLLWHQQLQKMKKYRTSQKDSLECLRNAFGLFTNQVQKSHSRDNHLKTSMKSSLTKGYEGLKKKLRTDYHALSLGAIRRCLQTSLMFS